MNVQRPLARGTTRDETIWNSFEIRYSFPVVFTEGLFDPANTSFVDALEGAPARLLFVVDDGVAAAHPDLLDRIVAYAAAHAGAMDLAMAAQTIPGGEIAKTDPATLAHVQSLIHDARIDRHSYVVAIGGGAVLDMVGLAAATAHRGVRHIRVPTTVLSQNDSGVGVKNAVNFRGIKNYTGTFAPPEAVLNDHDFIAALPARERIAGIAEAVKVALIRDAEFFRWIEQNVDTLAAFAPGAERHMIRHCAALHVRQISRGGDPFETGSARPLDYGHWSAHKLEALTGHALRHGEAVAIGIALDARYSVLSGLLAEGEEDRVIAVLRGLGLGIYHPALETRGADDRLALLEGLAEFREHLGGELTITLLKDLGVGIEVHEMDDARVIEAIDWLAPAIGRGIMILGDGLGALTYCLNVHPTQTLAEIEAAVTAPLGQVKSAICPDGPFATGLRIPAEALAEIDTPDAVEAFRRLHHDRDLLPLTVNGFPYGPFHGTRVKEEVYLPDWRSPQRLDYTMRLADLMAKLNPEGTFVSLSTVPGAFKPNAPGNEALIADTILRAVAHLVALGARTGRRVALAIEPEPFCMFETIDETVAFFHTYLMTADARARVSDLSGCYVDNAMLGDHLGLCYDTCHAAIEFEDAKASIDALSAAEIPIHKLQLSSALSIAEGSDEARRALSAYDEATYLHQLVARAPSGALSRFSDLGTALGADGARNGEEWRVHFHVPLFAQTAGPFGTTQGFLREILAIHRADPISPHLEVETYTWGVMPEGLRGRDLAEGISRELDWVLRELAR